MAHDTVNFNDLNDVEKREQELYFLENLNDAVLVLQSSIDMLDEKVEKVLTEFEGLKETLDNLSEELQEVLYNERYDEE